MLVEETFRYRITDFDREVFRRFVPVDDPLVLAEEEIDWEAFREILAPYYSAGRGQPAIDPVRMLKLEFLKYRHNLSDQQVMGRATTDLAFRYFLQVGYTFRTPDPSSLCRNESRLSSRVTHLQELVAWAEQQPTPADRKTHPATASAWEKFQRALALAQKILQDREPQANRKTLSVHDPEARRGKHGEFYDGYLTDILMDADSEIITQINVLEAGGDEARDAVDLVRGEQAAHGNQIEGLSIDGAGFNGQMLRELEGPAESEEEQGMGVKTFVPPKAQPSGGRFTPDDYEAEYRRARDRATTAQFKQVRREHPAVERKLNEVLNHHGGRRARYWGQKKFIFNN